MIWSIEYYTQFFDVDTKQVLDRCWAAIFPKTPFLDVLGGNPDLYGNNAGFRVVTLGPFWISSTTIIILYFSSTLAGYLAARHLDTKYYYDFTLLTAAAGLMYGYIGVIPAILWVAMKWYGCEPSLLEILCLYGYGGMIVWIPVVCSLRIRTKHSHS
jgi:protein YIPF1/2